MIVKLDADVSMEPDYFERLLAGVRRRPDARHRQRALLERDGEARVEPRYVTGTTRCGALARYRRECLQRRLAARASGWAGTASTS